MAFKLRDLFVSIGFDVKDQDLKALDKGLKQTKRLILGVGAVATAASGILLGMAKNVANVGDQAAKTADKLGVGIEALQEMRYAAEIAGVAQNQFDTALQRMTRRAAEAARGTGEAKDALKELGVIVSDSNGRMKSSEDLLADIADGMARVEDPSRRVALAFKLFDTEGVGMVNMLRDGGQALRNMRAEARSLGYVISDADARSAEKFNDELLRTKLVMVGVKNAIGVELLPVFTGWMERFRGWMKENKEAVFNLDNLARALRMAGIAAGIFLGAYSASAIGNVVMGIQTLTKAMNALGTAGLIANVKIAGVPLAIASLLAIAAATNFLFWEDLFRFGKDGKSVTGVLVEKFENAFEKIKQTARALKDALLEIFESIALFIGEKIEWLKSKIRPLEGVISSGTRRLGGWLETGTKWAGDAIQGVFSMMSLGPGNAPSSTRNISKRQSIRVDAPITVIVPEGKPPSAVSQAVLHGVSDEFRRIMSDTFNFLEPTEQE